MRQVRIAAAVLAIITALVDALFFLNPDTGLGVLLPTALGAVCLAAAVPIDALEPPARRLVFIACAGFVAAMAVAALFALRTLPDRAPVAMLAALLVAGSVLAARAFAIRNRRRRPGWATYFDR